MKWNRSNAIGLARATCTWCNGDGVRVVRGHRETPCHCVFRAVFRACYNRFRECALAARTGSVDLEFCPGAERRQTYSFKQAEYVADFCLVTRRILNEFDYKIFKYHYFLGADWRLCCRQLKMDRGTYFHHLYRIQQALGRGYADLEPYPLWPLDHYFGSYSQPPKLSIQAELKKLAEIYRLPLSA
jgi:hypothetical protein